MKTGRFIKKYYKAILSVILIVSLTFLEVSYKAYAAKASRTYGIGFGVNSKDDQLYIWTKVENQSDPMYKFLFGYDDIREGEDYGKGKSFRVMLVHNYKEELAYRSHYRDHAYVSWGLGFSNIPWYTYDFDVYYEANWTEFVYGGTYHYNNSTVRDVDKNPQIRSREKQFVTRGAQRAFVVNIDPSTLKSNPHRYSFYFPDENDREAETLMTFYYRDGIAFDNSSNLLLFDKNGNLSGFNDNASAYTSSYYKNKASASKLDIYRDTWAIKQKNGYFIIEADSGSGATIGIDEDCDFYAHEFSSKSNHNEFTIFVGRPVPEDAFDALTGSHETKDASLIKGNRTISKPTYLKRDEKYTVDSDSVLFVDSVLILNGELVNKGIVVINRGGAIVSTAEGTGTINCVGGDFIIREGGMAFVNTFKGENQQLMLSWPLQAANVELKNSIMKSYGSYRPMPYTSLIGFEFLKFNMNSFGNITASTNPEYAEQMYIPAVMDFSISSNYNIVGLTEIYQ